MPASRSVRAMILAPRSCPSKPGFATTTRIGRLAISPRVYPGLVARGAGSEDRRLAVDAPHRPARLADLALAGVGPRALDQVRHHVLVGGGGGLERGEGPIHGSLAAVAAHRGQRRHLALLDLERHLQDLERLVV